MVEWRDESDAHHDLRNMSDMATSPIRDALCCTMLSDRNITETRYKYRL
jgi:hypothetical protein